MNGSSGHCHYWLSFIIIFMIKILLIIPETNGAIVPPPWSDPINNPCATQPGGWQLLYWAPLKKCFKIFTMGYPCPDTMELSPIGSISTMKHMAHGSGNGMSSAQCRCPPGTALSSITNQCHRLFERGPCETSEFFSPIPETLMEMRSRSLPKNHQGQCRKPEKCFNGMATWPQDGKCYTLYTKGPCSKGKLLNINKDGLAECMCSNQGDLSQYFYSSDGSCHEHFTKGPCEQMGQLFLPGGKCGCHVKLPHYHQITNQCFEIGTIGPCPMGHVFIISDNNLSKTQSHASCQCKEGYAIWKDGYCYRQYTRGPCLDGEFLLNSTDCIKNPCTKGRLYFPDEKTCYRVGSQGPCNWQQVVVFDFTTRPSIDGISYNGVCGCTGIIKNLDQQCSSSSNENGNGGGGGSVNGEGSINNHYDQTPTQSKSACESIAGMVELNGECYKLYNRGPCGPGQWLEPRKLLTRMDKRGAHCQCRPGYTKYESSDGMIGCYAPSVGIARYLNGKTYKSYTFGFRRFITLLGGDMST